MNITPSQDLVEWMNKNTKGQNQKLFNSSVRFLQNTRSSVSDLEILYEKLDILLRKEKISLKDFISTLDSKNTKTQRIALLIEAVLEPKMESEK